MKNIPPKFLKTVAITFNEAEYNQFYQSFTNTIYRSLNEYGRNLLLSRPVKIKYHDVTIDNYIESCVDIKKSINNILFSDKFSDAEKQRIEIDIKCIKDIMIEIQAYVRQNKLHEKHT